MFAKNRGGLYSESCRFLIPRHHRRAFLALPVASASFSAEYFTTLDFFPAVAGRNVNPPRGGMNQFDISPNGTDKAPVIASSPAFFPPHKTAGRPNI